MGEAVGKFVNVGATDLERQLDQAWRRIFIMAHPLFVGVPPESQAMQEFLKLVELHTYERGELIYSRGGVSEHLYLVKDGEIHNERLDHQTRENNLIGIQGPGSIFGEVGLFTQSPRTTNARAYLRSNIYVMPGEALRTLMEEETSVGGAIATLATRRLRKQIGRDNIEKPSRLILVLYPEHPKVSVQITRRLAGELAHANADPVALCAFSPEAVRDRPEGASLATVLGLWPEVQDERLKAMMEKEIRPYGLLRGDALHSARSQESNLMETVIAILSRLRSRYGTIIVDGGAIHHNPVIARIILQSDQIVLIRKGEKAGVGERTLWENARQHMASMAKDFEDKVITVTEEESGFGMDDLNRIIDRNSPLYRRHVRLRGADTRSDVFERDIARLSRRLNGTSRGLCLGGGGARAFAHIGVIQVLEEAGIDFDAVIGASMGAIVGAGYAMGWPSDELGYRLSQILPTASSIMDKTLPVLSFYKGHKLSKAILKGFGDLRFEDMELPFYCNGSDLNTGATVVFDRGYVASALRATVSLPGVFPPLKMGYYDLVDGGVLNNLPGHILRNRGLDRVLGVNVSPLQEKMNLQPPTPSRKGLKRMFDWFSAPPILDIVHRSLTMEGQELLKFRINDFDLVIHPRVVGYGVFDFHELERLTEQGRKEAQSRLSEIKAALAPRVRESEG